MPRLPFVDKCAQAGLVVSLAGGVAGYLFRPMAEAVIIAMLASFILFADAAGFGAIPDFIPVVLVLLAALVGAMSGAIHGSEVIPPEWIEKVRRPAGVCLKFASQRDIPEVARQLVEIAYERT